MNVEKVVKQKDVFKLNKWTVAIILMVLIVAGTFINLLSYIALLVGIVVILFFSERDSLCVLIFIMPFAMIFKSLPNASSFFTYLLLFFVLVQFSKDKTLNARLLSILLFTVVLFVVQIANQALNITRSIKFIANFLFLFYALKSSTIENYKEIFKAYIYGVIASSLVALLNISPNINLYIRDTEYIDNAIDVVRFKGLYSDPNYYSINVIISFCLIFCLYQNKEINGIFATVLSCVLFIFVVLTYSKSAFLMLSLPIMLLLYSQIKQRKYISLLVVTSIIVVLMALIFLGRIELFNVVLSRFNTSDGMDSLTTGRTAIWRNYFLYFKDNIFDFIFGSGIDAELVNGKGSHNAYIDVLYYLGVFGGVILCYILRFLFKDTKKTIERNFFNYSVLLCILVMYCFLSMLFYYDFVFHVLLAFIAFNVPIETKIRIKEEKKNG